MRSLGRIIRRVVALVVIGAFILAIPLSTTRHVTVSTGARPAAPRKPSAPVGPTPGATNVQSFGASGGGTTDDTAAFLHAEDAALASSVRFASGPTGSPQAVVYVPPGAYRLIHLAFRSNIRMEVDAGAVLEQAGGRHVSLVPGPAALINWDAPIGPPLTNVTLIGVNQADTTLKALANPVFTGWSLSSDFTFDLDPGTTDGSVDETGLQAENVSGFLIENVYSIENASQPKRVPKTQDGWWPSTRRAALGLREDPATPTNGSAFYDPHNGTVSNWYNIDGPKGFGPNQVGAGHNVAFQHIFSLGGTTLRLETDASLNKSFPSEIRGLSADDIVGMNCNRAVSFSPHAQMNFDVTVTHVQSVGCFEGVVESFSPNKRLPAGSFVNSTIANVAVAAGTLAQDGSTDTGLWTTGPSFKAFSVDPQISWAVTYTAGTFTCTGTYLRPPDPITTTAGVVQPVCSLSAPASRVSPTARP